ncbi:MAG: putative bifunctional diguanylate cyclase/phosphodiesterase [Pseudomonadota bacterium]
MSTSLSKALFGLRPGSLLGRYSADMRRFADRRTADLSHMRDIKLERLDALMRRIVEANFDGVMTVQKDGKLGMVNKAAADMFGYPPQHLINAAIDEIVPGYRIFTDPRSEDFCVGSGHRETLGVRADGSGFPIDLCLSETLFGSNQLIIAIVRDITATKEHRRQLEHQALHDALTGLPNRVLLSDRLEHAMHTARRTDEPLALLLLDLDNFKDVNDTLGHHIGDMLLVEIGRRLVKPLRESDTVARLGGDEFAILLPSAASEERALEVATRVRAMILQPVTVMDGLNLEVGVSIGIALYPGHAQEPSKLMQCADVAMYAAKAGSEKIVIYDEEKDTNNVRHLTLTGELRLAIQGRQVDLAFQPMLSLKDKKTRRMEALARWHHPRLGPIPPSEFVIQAERTGMIQLLTRHVFEQALAQWLQWRQEGLDMAISVNLSPRTLHDRDLPAILGAILRESTVPADRVTLEITETAIFLDPDGAGDNVRRLRNLGVRIAIDDFGTGYSSLSYLQKLPLNELKIDRSFVGQMADNENDVVIVRSTIDLAHNLGLEVVAEGVESTPQLDILSRLHCDYAQGFLIAPPMAAKETGPWLVRQGAKTR